MNERELKSENSGEKQKKKKKKKKNARRYDKLRQTGKLQRHTENSNKRRQQIRRMRRKKRLKWVSSKAKRSASVPVYACFAMYLLYDYGTVPIVQLRFDVA